MKRPDTIINLMGCFVGIGDTSQLEKRFPMVDVFSPPSDIKPLVNFLMHNARIESSNYYDNAQKILESDISFELPENMQNSTVSAFLPIILGCSHACSYCIVPLKRGREISRKPEEIIADVHKLIDQGVKEVTLLGQIVDRYGKDDPSLPTLGELIKRVHEVEKLERIRFLTSHPNWVTDELIQTLSSLPKVMPHFELPIQAGNDQVLRNMRRGYTVEKFMTIVKNIRDTFENPSIATDLIVGFPGETKEQFLDSVETLKEFRPDMTHVARYSPRPKTYASENLIDDVSDEEKWERFRTIEKLQEEISTEINQKYQDQVIQVLVENKKKNRWFGRTPTNKLVFINSEEDLFGKIIPVRIHWTGPWSLVGNLES